MIAKDVFLLVAHHLREYLVQQMEAARVSVPESVCLGSSGVRVLHLGRIPPALAYFRQSLCTITHLLTELPQSMVKSDDGTAFEKIRQGMAYKVTPSG